MKTLPAQLRKNLAPLLMALAVSQAYAVEVVVIGDAGIDGISGGALGEWGMAGTSASAISRAISQSLPGSLQLVLYGGRGGDGGNGGGMDDTTFAGHGAVGGHGAAANGSASAVAAALDVTVHTLVYGGNGGRGGATGSLNSEYDWQLTEDGPYIPALGMSGIGGRGGAASTLATATTAGGGNVDVKAVARGGGGGSVEGQAGRAGMGGGASATAFGRSDTGRVSVAAEAYGGHGGGGDIRRRSGGGSGADVTMTDAVAGRTSGVLVLAQHAQAGSSGYGVFSYGDGVGDTGQQRQFAGNALSQLSVSDADASAVSAQVTARGGNAGGIGLDSEFTSDTGGTAWAALTLASTRQGAALDGLVRADGGEGMGYYFGGAGGRADARAVLSGLGDVRGAAMAHGGNAGESLFGGAGGDARAVLAISAAGLATGEAYAAGGGTGASSGYYRPPVGAAEVEIELVGAGARGSASADGRSSDIRLNARTTGALAVDLTASAGKSGAANVAVGVRSGVDAAPAGSAPVRVRAYAEAPREWSYYESSPSMSAIIDVAASGDIDGVSRATSGDVTFEYGSSGAVNSSARGVTSGSHTVVLSAISHAGASLWTAPTWRGANANASVYGQSGSGSVNVTAEALAGRNSRVNGADAPQATASATAVNLAPGGYGVAHASAWGGNADARASAAGIGATGMALRVTGGAATVTPASWQWPANEALQITMASGAHAANRFDAARFALPAAAPGGASAVTNVSAGPAEVGEIAGLAPVVAAAFDSLAGVGMHALAYDTPQANPWGSSYVEQAMLASGRFEFDAVGAGQHLLLGFVSGAFTGDFGWLELSISNNGVGLFSRAFSSANDALLFLNNNVLDLGLLGAGRQDVLVSSSYLFADPGFFNFKPGALAFNYVVGAGAGSGAGVSPVPEASSWLMLVAGLGCVLLVARRRRPAARPA